MPPVTRTIVAVMLTYNRVTRNRPADYIVERFSMRCPCRSLVQGSCPAETSNTDASAAIPSARTVKPSRWVVVALIDTDAAEANYRDGLLEIKLPKRAPREVRIAVDKPSQTQA